MLMKIRINCASQQMVVTRKRSKSKNFKITFNLINLRYIEFYLHGLYFLKVINNVLFLQKLKQKNQQLKQIMDQLRNLIWDINAMLAMRN